MSGGLRRGKLVRWNDDRGFGFIQPVDGSQDIFLHISDIQDATRRPQNNDIICYVVTTQTDGKRRAKNAFILGARRKPKSTQQNHALNAAIPPRFPLLEVMGLSILPTLGSLHLAWATNLFWPLILYPVMSGVTYALYAVDKSRAQRGAWRISEENLHFCELIGGWIGGFIAQQALRHKSRKQSYQATFWAIVVLHHLAWLWWLFWGRGLSFTVS